LAWFSRFTRFGDMHFVYSQEAGNSCGIASVMMCVFKVNKLTPGASALHKEQEVYKVYGDIIGSSYDGSVYTYASKLAQTLNKLNCGQWKHENVGADKVCDTLMSKVGVSGAFGAIVNVTPAIVLVRWAGGGGHFVVVDTVRSFAGSKYATVCDPWDAQLRVTKITSGQVFDYRTASTTSVNFGPDPSFSYSAVDEGSANGHMVYLVRN